MGERLNASDVLKHRYRVTYLLPITGTNTISREYKKRNLGADEIIQINYDDSTRVLVKVLDTYYDFLKTLKPFAPVDNQEIGFDSFKIYFTETRRKLARETPHPYPIKATIIPKNWKRGDGKFGLIGNEQPDVIFTEDINEIVKLGNGGSNWIERSEGKEWSVPGGDVKGNPGSDVYFIDDGNTRMMVDLHGYFLDNGLDLDGILLHTSKEFATDEFIQYYSPKSHTVHKPYILVSRMSPYDKSSREVVPSGEIRIQIEDASIKYKVQDFDNLIRLDVKERFPVKQYQKIDTSYRLPRGSQYSVRDIVSDLAIIPYDETTTIDCDDNGSYIVLNFNNWIKHRTYYIEIRVPHGNGYDIYKLDGQPFELY